MTIKTSLKPSDFPTVRGRITENAPLGEVSWFRCGGCADVLFKPEDAEDLADFLRSYCHPERSEGSQNGGNRDSSPAAQDDITVLGVMSNCIIRDGGVRGVVIRLGRAFAGIEALSPEEELMIRDTYLVKPGDRLVRAGAAALDGNVAAFAAREGIAGLAFLSGIPGTIGGALRMNAGAYGAEIKDVLVMAEAVDRAGQIHYLVPCHSERSEESQVAGDNRSFANAQDDDIAIEEMGMSYRHTDVPEDYIFTSCILRGMPGNAEEIKAEIAEIKAKRGDTQPIREKTGGSTFANPSPEELAAAGLPEGTKAWQLVDQVGGRGLTIGGAQMSEKHANFMINTGTATAADLEALGEEIRRRVREETGLELRWEIRRIGDF